MDKAVQDLVDAAVNKVKVKQIIYKSMVMDSDDHSMDITATITYMNNTTKEVVVENVPGTQPYNAGKSDATTATVSAGTLSYSNNYADLTIPLTLTHYDGTTQSKSVTVAGARITASDISQYQTAVYNSSSGNFIVYVQADVSNGDSAKTTLSVDGTKAYQAGWIKGYNAAADTFEQRSGDANHDYYIYGPNTTSTYDIKSRARFPIDYTASSHGTESQHGYTPSKLVINGRNVTTYENTVGSTKVYYTKSDYNPGTSAYKRSSFSIGNKESV